jgi:organic hydroperoxide reductase OsmC/OhrA/plastocyanin
MAEHAATVEWRVDGPGRFRDGSYSRAHSLSFDGGAEVKASASPHNVPLPMADPAGVDPEEMLVAATASCHMLWFLDLARGAGLDVASYRDEAIGRMGKLDGRLGVARIVLRPRIAFDGETPDAETLARLHHEAEFGRIEPPRHICAPTRKEMPMTRLALGLAGAAAAAVLAVPAVAQPDWSHATRVEVKLANFSYTPSMIHLRAGQPVMLHLVNTASGGHDFAAREFFAAASLRNAGAVDRGRVELGGHESQDIFLVPHAGRYPLKCTHTFHKTFGMSGEIVVD